MTKKKKKKKSNSTAKVNNYYCEKKNKNYNESKRDMVGPGWVSTSKRKSKTNIELKREGIPLRAEINEEHGKS